MLFAAGEFGMSNPEILQRTVWWFLALHFGFRARDESRKLLWGDVDLQEDPVSGREMLVWLAERGTKTRKGQESGHQRCISAKSVRNWWREVSSAILQDVQKPPTS